ncbi:MAG: Glutamine synthetase family protein in hypothetical Actinobacterial gene cluster, partial [uncultured Pseudonocardia sp.]
DADARGAAVARRRRHGRHRPRRVHRHAGPVAGQAVRRAVLPGPRRPAPRRGVQLPARRRRRDEHGARLRDVELGARLRRLRAAPRHGDAADAALARGDGAGALRRRVGRRLARRRLAAAGAAPPARPARRARAGGRRRHRAGVHPVRRHLRRGGAARLPRPHPGQRVQRRLLAPGHREGGAGAAPDPQRHGRGGDGRGVGEGGVQPRPARDRVPLRRRADDVRQPRDLQDRGQGDRRPGRHGADLHGEVRRPRGQFLPRARVAARGGRQRLHRRRRARVVTAVRALPRRSAALPARADLPVRAQRQLLQAVRRGVVRPHGGRLGDRQPHVRVAGGRARPGAARGEPGARRRHEPLPGGGRAGRRRAGGDRGGAAAAPGAERQRLRLRRPAGAGDAAGGRRAVHRLGAGPLGAGRRGGGPLRQRGAGGAHRLRRRRHRLGTAAWLRAAL